ncbi:nitroreductase family deazaflavin-dependent oxidoreductase [Mycobacterium sp. 21AC1]|uniref:nitroreductase family deazaflavin-dependent oxidoreductase n=1 Tax=[Mycobacterium] appelbergii TaxID=2939269 RepID=UPI0029393C79|nr:nitroreductase family deazaflavin-dependent oxidoreductase [Mycobacterium sp. 21AC1]MDV3124761.1 nitroreductase family deazaflavin-dependent oxidoreductase [Mycobacterium sp. 21AC1]
MSAENTFADIGARILRNRWLMRAPIWLYRAGAGALLGSRVLMLEHIGRKSGTRRYVVLEVIDHPTPDTYVVASGFGSRAQWFRNIEADPHIRVWAASRKPRHGTARILSQDEADRTLAVYRNRRPKAWEQFKPILEDTLGQPITDTDTPLPMVALQLS